MQMLFQWIGSLLQKDPKKYLHLDVLMDLSNLFQRQEESKRASLKHIKLLSFQSSGVTRELHLLHLVKMDRSKFGLEVVC